MKTKTFLAALCCLISMSVFAESGTCGDNLTWELSNGTLTISGTGSMYNYYNYSSNSCPWDSFKENIYKVNIQNGVTSIGGSAFEDCTGLTSVTIGESVTSIGDYAFKGCSGLTSITIPNSVTSIGYWAFYGCSSLPVIDGLRYADTYLVKAVDKEITTAKIADGTKWIGDYAFEYCSGLTSVTIPNSVTSIGNKAFYNCSGLTSVTIGESVTSIDDGTFSCCLSLTSITIPESVTSIGDGAFSCCQSLTSITIPNSVTNIGDYAFYGCSELTSITIPNSVTSIGTNTFKGCSFTDIVLPSSLETIGENAFASNAIKTITCYSKLPPSVYGDDGYYYYGYWYREIFIIEDSLTDDVIIYVPADYLNTYKAHDFWGQYDIRPIEATTTPTDDIQVTSDENTANIIWSAIDGAATYYLIITDQQGNVICTLVFNANGQLMQIAFGAPRSQAVEQTSAEGFSFIVTGLQNGTTYQFTLDALDEEGNIIDRREGEFTTTDTATGLDGCSTINPQASIQKVLINGKVFIINNGHTYNLQGATVK